MTKINAIIFDLGGVILNLDQERTFRAFKRLGADFELLKKNQHLFDEVEAGKLSSNLFLLKLQKELPDGVTITQITHAFNQMLLDIPPIRINFLKELAKKVPVFLFSNTNQIHIDYFNAYFNQTFPTEGWQNLFKQIFYSHQIGIRKPHKEAFEKVLGLANLNAATTLFIDDATANLKGAELCGLQTYHANEPLNEGMFNQLFSRL